MFDVVIRKDAIVIPNKLTHHSRQPSTEDEEPLIHSGISLTDHDTDVTKNKHTKVAGAGNWALATIRRNIPCGASTCLQ